MLKGTAAQCSGALRHGQRPKVWPFVNVWTSSLTRSVASTYNPTTGRLTIDLANFDPLLDSLVSSHGRIAFSVAQRPPLVVPPWAEVARVVEDCRV